MISLGKFVYRNCAIDLFRQRRRDWEELQGRESKKRKLFAEIIGGDISASKSIKDWETNDMLLGGSVLMRKWNPFDKVELKTGRKNYIFFEQLLFNFLFFGRGVIYHVYEQQAELAYSYPLNFSLNIIKIAKLHTFCMNFGW